jgi:hypothetical protein
MAPAKRLATVEPREHGALPATCQPNGRDGLQAAAFEGV